MKKTILLSIIALAGLAFVAPKTTPNAQVEFKTLPLEEVLKIATEQNKHVFVDVSTSWCGWCKKMKANTYTNPSVIAHLNKKYINVSIDAEKGDGPMVAKKYRVKGYPTQLILDENGVMLSKNVGYMNPEELLKFAVR